MQDAEIKSVATIEDLSVSFAGHRVLHGFNLSLPPRTITVILGRSGSGKSTFLRTLNRLNECFPGSHTDGRVRLFLSNEWVDVYSDGFALTELRRRVGMVFQSPNVLPSSIGRNIALPLKLVMGLSAADAARRMEWALREAQLWDEVEGRLHHPATTLSGGQQQRLCLARALAMEPEFLLLDEPTASLDFQASAKIEELLLRLKDRYTIVAVSHSLSQAGRLADRIVVINQGTVVGTFEPEDFRGRETFERLVENIF